MEDLKVCPCKREALEDGRRLPLSFACRKYDCATEVYIDGEGTERKVQTERCKLEKRLNGK